MVAESLLAALQRNAVDEFFKEGAELRDVHWPFPNS